MQRESGQKGEENGTQKGKESEEEIAKDSRSGGEKERKRARPSETLEGSHTPPTPPTSPQSKIPGTWVVRGQKRGCGDFPGPPVVRTPPFHCRGHRFSP